MENEIPQAMCDKISNQIKMYKDQTLNTDKKMLKNSHFGCWRGKPHLHNGFDQQTQQYLVNKILEVSNQYMSVLPKPNKLNMQDVEISTQWNVDAWFNMNEKGTIGYEWSYSDVNYLLLSEIVEETTGTSFYLAMRDLLQLDDLGLDHTWFYTLEKDPKNIKTLIHQYKESRNWASTYDDSPTFGLYGPSGIVSSTGELAKFSKYLFGNKIFKRIAFN